MERINGVTVSVTQNGERKSIDVDGHLGVLSKDTVLIEVHITHNTEIHGVVVDGSKNVILKKNLSSLIKPSPEDKTYQIKIPVAMDLEGNLCTKYPSNYMGLLELTKEGQLNYWEIALVSQHGLFFLTAQQIYRTNLYLDGERIVCPFFEGAPHKWPQMVRMAAHLLGETKYGLKPLSKYHFEPERTPGDDLDPNAGTVIWWNLAQGLGAIATSKGEARVHWKGIKQARLISRLKFLSAGEIVRYQSLRRVPIQPFKERRTTFKWEALDVVSLDAL